ncbi:hypothetical protein CEXT_60021 [Caerostris extrusa]|uniref:Uncharacterized protein n=1 Tax=Caerostris extrusa TaxID=172846 RepID=A0AAV4XXL9_CAEEX|nr:hypothetical protein CEXT_60021 [Caerostris extrusa]
MHAVGDAAELRVTPERMGHDSSGQVSPMMPSVCRPHRPAGGTDWTGQPALNISRGTVPVAALSSLSGRRDRRRDSD